MYEITLTTLKQSANNERLWFNTYVKYGKACLNSKDFAQLSRVVNELHRSCQSPDGRDDPTKGTYVLEVYALEIQASVCSASVLASPLAASFSSVDTSPSLRLVPVPVPVPPPPQWCTATKNTSRMKTIYPKTLNVEAAVADPRIMG